MASSAITAPVMCYEYQILPQVCSLLRRILPAIGPKNMAPMINVRVLPPLGYSAIAEAVNSAATINQLGLLDCFLAIISKALSVQVKAKGRSSNLLQVLTGASNITALTLSSLVNHKIVPGETAVKSQRWYLRGTISKTVASEVVKLLKDMMEGSFGAQWEGYAKSAIGQAVLHLTKINEEARMPVPGMFSQTVSSACMLTTTRKVQSDLPTLPLTMNTHCYNWWFIHNH